MPKRAASAALASLVAVSTLAVAPAVGQADASPGRDTFWIGAGLGAGSGGFAGNLNASYQFGANLVSMRTTATAGVFDDEFSDYALLFGRATQPAGEPNHLGAAVGIALVDGCRGGGVFSSCRDIATVVGLPFEVQGFWRPGRLVGLGFYAFANLNSAQSFAGLTLGLQLGRLH